MKQISNIIKFLPSHKLYVYYSLAYGLSTLIVPLGVQFLVNNLALSGIWLNISIFIILTVVCLGLSQMIKHSQLILSESLQREIFYIEMKGWKDFSKKEYSHYYFEVFNLLKSFSKSYSSIIELGLVMFFGLITLILFHPFFLIIAAIIILTIVQVYKTSSSGQLSSIEQSNQKYKIYSIIKSDDQVQDSNLIEYLEARDNHFNFIRKNSFKISFLLVIVQGLLLLLGSYFIKLNQLSVGQLVSAEIIVSGIFIPLSKLPIILESIFDYETSKLKIEKAVGEKNA